MADDGAFGINAAVPFQVMQVSSLVGGREHSDNVETITSSSKSHLASIKSFSQAPMVCLALPIGFSISRRH